MTAHFKRIAVGIVGGLVLLIGIAMIALPGPAFVVIPAGLAIFSTQFEWARRWREKAVSYFRDKRQRFHGRRKRTS